MEKFAWIAYVSVVFLLIVGWVALLLMPPWGTALAILVAIIFAGVNS